MKFRSTVSICLGIAVGLSGCGEKKESVITKEGPVFWQERDDFSQMDASYLDVKIPIDTEIGQYVVLQFQCFRHVGAQVSVEKNLIINSESDSSNPNVWGRSFDAVLYKPEGESAQIYRHSYGGEVLSNFTNATLDLDDVLRLDEQQNFKGTAFRFVYGASPITSQIADIADLSRADSVDFDLNPSDYQTAEFLRACAPVKNWTPTE